MADANLSLLTEPMAVNLVRVIAQWPDVVQNVLKTLEPTTILTYVGIKNECHILIVL